MKKTVYLLMLCATVFLSCKEMDGTYKEFIVPNGIVYPQKADSVKVYAGENRVKITWQKGSDPKVIGAWIYWNNYTDSLHVDIPANSDRILSAIVENLEETSYTFQIKTYDADGNVSIASEATGRAYGAEYRLSLFPRELTGNQTFSDRVELSWGSAPSSMLQFILKYRTSSDVPVELIIPPNESKTVITDYKPLSAFTVEAHYLPVATAIDTFKVIENYEFLPYVPIEVRLPDEGIWTNAKLPTDTWESLDGNYSAFPFENLWIGAETASPPNNMIWVCPPTSPIPQHFTISLGYRTSISRMHIWPRLTEELYTGTFPREIELWGSDNPPADGSWNNWHLLGKWQVHKPSGYGDGRDVGPITAEDADYFHFNQEYKLEVTDEITNPYRTVSFIRFKTVSTFASYGTEIKQGLIIIQEIALWGILQ